MIIYPAIDLKEGKCVRLLRGDMANAMVFSENPAEQAKQFAAAGCEWLHVIDLDGAFQGNSVNTRAVREIISSVPVKIQLGGGIRKMQDIEHWLRNGATRVILGTIAHTQPELVREACKAFPGKIAVGIDARDGMVAIRGWAEVTTQRALDLVRSLEDMGVCTLIYTDISRDGALQGPNIPQTLEIARAVSIPVIASGGISSLEDIRGYTPYRKEGIQGLVLGRALYEHKVKLDEAIQVASEG